MLVDSHSHLDAAEFDHDRPAVLQRARDAGVTRHIVCGTDADQWTRMRSVCVQALGLHAAYGLHPTFLSLHRPEHLGLLREWIGRERPVAVGECGLDYFVEGLDRDAQMEYFDAQLRIAREFNLPVVAHARRAVDAVIAAIRRIGGLRGVVHSFPGSRQQADQLFEHGFLLGFGGPV
nr:TatD family hydrolase [Lysobacter sp.]